MGRPTPAFLARASEASLRVGIFATFFCGTVVWCVYRAALTSELVAQVAKKPFDSLESFYASDYQ